MPSQPFHHGNLRNALLDQAEQTLRERGIDALSLRELARQAGVSHGAPRSHFADRQALLDALAERGYDRITDELRALIEREGGDLARTLRAIGAGYIRFAVSDAALLDLMFAAKIDDGAEAVHRASMRMFGVMQGLLGDATLLFVATMQGIAAMVASRRITVEQGDALIGDAIGLFVPA